MPCCCSCRRSDPLSDSLICCHPENPFTDRKRICCDCDGKCCGRYEEARRDCFWPDFTHPRWLCCRILYGCDPGFRCPPRPCEEEEKKDDDHGHRGCGCH